MSKPPRSFEDKQAFETYQKAASGLYVSTEDYLSNQPEITEFERRVLCEWIADIAETSAGRINMCDSYQLAVSFIDRFCSTVHVPLDLYQLVGITSLFLATKFCDPNPLKAKFFALLTDGDFTVEDIREMEKQILDKLRWNCNDPLPCIFITQYSSRLACVSSTDRNLIWTYSNLFIEKMLYDYKLSRYHSPILAAAAFTIAAICVEVPESVVLDALQEDFSLSESEISMIEVHQCILDSFTYLTTKAPFRRSENVTLPDDPYIEYRLQDNLKQAQASVKLVFSESVPTRMVEKRRHQDEPQREVEKNITTKKRKSEQINCVVEFGLVSPRESVEDAQGSVQSLEHEIKPKLIAYTPHTPDPTFINDTFTRYTESAAILKDVSDEGWTSKKETLDLDQVVPCPSEATAGNTATSMLSWFWK